jgi:hypothetical protein
MFDDSAPIVPMRIVPMSELVDGPQPFLLGLRRLLGRDRCSNDTAPKAAGQC